ncbi:MAGE family-domain-containing protein [Amylostereum chailletii]|nr:MAGE family-domain-containing protein [Amylostereum chailletii]
MARAGPSRSQRHASQSQPEPTQTQRGGRNQTQRRGRRADDEDEDEDEELGDEEDGEEDSVADPFAQDLNKKIAGLVRLALFNEQKRLPLRREEISKRVLGSQRSAFKPVFDGAQQILRATFGMELVELQTRSAAHGTATGKDADKDKRKKASQSQANGDANDQTEVAGGKKKAAAQGSKSYILRSILDAGLIEHASHSDANILEAEMADAPEDIDEDEAGTRQYGSLLSWNGSDQLAALGILYVVLALILVNGKVVSDMDLHTLLRRLNLRESAVLELSAQSTHRTVPIEAYLSQLVRQGFLDRTRLGGGASGKRGRGTQAQDDGEGATFEWRWGPRAGAEVGEKAIARFVAEFMAERRGEVEESSDEDEEPRARKQRQRQRDEDAQKRLDMMMRGIERASGGDLADVV